MISKLLVLDYFAQPIKLNMKGNDKHPTVYGLLFTVLWVGVIIFVGITRLFAILDKTEPVTSRKNTFVTNYPDIDLTDSSFLPVFVAYSNDTEVIPLSSLSKYFTVYFEMVTYQSTVNQTDISTIKSSSRIDAVPCKSIKGEDRKAFESTYNDTVFRQIFEIYGLCPSLGSNITVTGKAKDAFHRKFKLVLRPCSLNLGCAPASELSQVKFQVLLPSSSIDLNDRDHPHHYFVVQEDYFTLSPSSFQQYSAKVGQGRVSDYSGFISSWSNVSSYVEIREILTAISDRPSSITTCTPTSVLDSDSQECPSYFQFVIQTSGYNTEDLRKYTSLGDLLSAVGGIQSTVALVIVLIYSPINSHFRTKFLIDKVYPLILEEKLTKKEIEARRKKLKEAQEKRKQLRVSPPGIVGAPGQSSPDYETQVNNGPQVQIRSPIPTYNEPLTKIKDNISELQKLKTTVGSPDTNYLAVTPSTHPNARKTKEAKEETPKSIWSKIFCLCEKTKEQKDDAKHKEHLFNRISDSIDVVSMVRDFNYLKILVHYLFDKKHFNTAQLAGFHLWEEEEKSKEELEKTIHEELNQDKSTNLINKEGKIFKQDLKRQIDNFLDSVADFQFGHEDIGDVPYTSVSLDTFFNAKIKMNVPPKPKTLDMVVQLENSPGFYGIQSNDQGGPNFGPLPSSDQMEQELGFFEKHDDIIPVYPLTENIIEHLAKFHPEYKEELRDENKQERRSQRKQYIAYERKGLREEYLIKRKGILVLQDLINKVHQYQENIQKDQLQGGDPKVQEQIRLAEEALLDIKSLRESLKVETEENIKAKYLSIRNAGNDSRSLHPPQRQTQGANQSFLQLTPSTTPLQMQALHEVLEEDESDHDSDENLFLFKAVSNKIAPSIARMIDTGADELIPSLSGAKLSAMNLRGIPQRFNRANY